MLFAPHVMNKTVNCLHGELYNKTIEREACLKQAGYKIVSIWEDDFIKGEYYAKHKNDKCG